MTSEDAHPIRVPDDRLDYNEDLIYFLNGERFTGIGYEDVPGHGLSEISYQDGMQDGPARDWYVTGQLKSEAIYFRNLLHGWSREFNGDGSLSSEKKYEYGVLIESSTFDEVGNVVERFQLAEDSPNFAVLQRLRAQFGT